MPGIYSEAGAETYETETAACIRYKGTNMHIYYSSNYFMSSSGQIALFSCSYAISACVCFWLGIEKPELA